MSELKKYLFDNFVVEEDDKEKIQEVPVIEESEQEAIIEPEEAKDIEPEKTFTEEELEEKVRQAEEIGYEKGFRSAAEGLDAENKNLLTALTAKIENIINANCSIKTELEKQFAEMSKLLIKKVIPPLQNEYADKIVADFIKENFDNIKDESKLTFYLNPETINSAQEVISKIADASDFEGKISIHKDDSLGKSEARIEWENGGVECKSEELIGAVTNLLDEN